jgi:hypothetical protein
MAIDFHDRQNAGTYAGREADAGWRRAIAGIVDPAGLHVVDVGCGGGIYSTALAQMGAAHVTGVDFSAPMVRDARQRAADSGVSTVTFRQGTAERTGLPDAAAQAVLHRALIHHLAEPVAAFVEARRLLAPGGTLLVQDRTMDDVLAPPSAQHLRGWLFELCPGSPLSRPPAVRSPVRSRTGCGRPASPRSGAIGSPSGAGGTPTSGNCAPTCAPAPGAPSSTSSTTANWSGWPTGSAHASPRPFRPGNRWTRSTTGACGRRGSRRPPCPARRGARTSSRDRGVFVKVPHTPCRRLMELSRPGVQGGHRRWPAVTRRGRPGMRKRRTRQ